MPKLRGIDKTGDIEAQCIERIRNVLFGDNGIANGLLSDFESAVNNINNTFIWKSAAYLEEES